MDYSKLLKDLTFNLQKLDLSIMDKSIIKNYTGWAYIEIVYLFIKIAMRRNPDIDGLKECLDLIEHDYNYIVNESVRYTPFNEDEILNFINTLKNSKLPNNLVLYRGTNIKWFYDSIRKREDNLKIGDRITNLLPWSTSLKQEVAASFCQITKEPMILEINLSSGPGIWLSPISLCASEYEIIIPPDMEFEVIDNSDITLTCDNSTKAYKHLTLISKKGE